MSKTGLFWYYGGSTTLEVELKRACERFYKKYGSVPDHVCFRPSTLKDKEKKKAIAALAKDLGLEITSASRIPWMHFELTTEMDNDDRG